MSEIINMDVEEARPEEEEEAARLEEKPVPVYYIDKIEEKPVRRHICCCPDTYRAKRRDRAKCLKISRWDMWQKTVHIFKIMFILLYIGIQLIIFFTMRYPDLQDWGHSEITTCRLVSRKINDKNDIGNEDGFTYENLKIEIYWDTVFEIADFPNSEITVQPSIPEEGDIYPCRKLDGEIIMVGKITKPDVTSSYLVATLLFALIPLILYIAIFKKD